MIVKFGSATAAVAVPILLWSILLSGGARAAHDGGAECLNCHALNANDIEAGTNSIAKQAMTEIKSYGWTQGMRLGCTFCHRSVNSAHIPDVLSSFSGSTPPGASRHPVARNFVTGAIDNTPYLSTDNTSFPQHLDCRNCHDITLTAYPNHDNNWLNDIGAAGRTKATNPFGLRSVTAPKAYDTLCRNCHASQAAFLAFTGKSGAGAAKLVLASHDNGVDNTTNAIRDNDNTHLRTQDRPEASAGRQCSICHDAHESQNLHLFSDGTEKQWDNTVEAAINETADCTTVCHYRGDPAGNYDLHGHGKATNWNSVELGRNCTFCHDPNEPHLPNDNGYFARNRFAPFDSSWLAPSALGRPVKSVCATCHGTKDPHATARGSVGCLDCHDQHAKASDNNVMMIRNTNRSGNPWGIIGGGAAGATPGSEAVLFAKSIKYPAGDNIFHYYTNVSYGSGDSANPGFCDQRACHGARSKGGVPFTPLSGYMPTLQHSGGTINTPNGNCESCHAHHDSGGSFRASSICVNCHGQPPPPQDSSPGEIYIYNEFLSPHRRHAGNNPSQRYYNFECRKCHERYTDSATHDGPSQGGPKTFQSVFFDNSVKMGAAAYDNANLRCSNITCHSDGRGGAPENTAYQWFNPAQASTRQTLDCGGCHRIAMVTGTHGKHLAQGFACSTCHVSTVSDNNSALNPTGGILFHVNGTRDVTIKAAYDLDGNPANNWDNATEMCSNTTCHGVPVDWTPPQPQPCDTCHSYVGGVPVASNVYDYSYDNALGTMSRVAPANFQNRGHGDNNGLPWDVASVPNLACLTCHDLGIAHDNASNPFRFRMIVNGTTVAPDNVNSLCAAASCHPNFATRADAHSSAVTGGGQPVPPRPFTHNQKCVDCHDVHGQANIYMIYDNLAAQTDNAAFASSDAFGIPLYPASRVPVGFVSGASGANYASTDNAAPFDGICEVCHTRTMQFRNAAGANSGRGPGNAHPSRACTECHRHGAGVPLIVAGGGFAGVGGNNVEQFVDNALRPPSATNYYDRSRHPVTLHPSNLTYPAEVDCLRCHAVGPLPTGGQRSNECLKCHFERRQGSGVYHPNGQYEWAVPATPGTQFGTAGPFADGFCLQCHGPGASGSTLNGVTPDNVIPSGEIWNGGAGVASGHGATASLSSDNAVGPPAYSCRECHASTAPLGSSPEARDNNAPTLHGSINRKLVVSDNAANPVYPHPGDNVYITANARSQRMDVFCAVRCHGNAGNGVPRDDGVVRHTWDILGGGSQTGSQTHPSDVPLVTGARYKNPATLPYSEYMSGALPGAGNVVCVTCHNPHGGAAGLVDGGGSGLSGGNKQMMRRSWSDNVSTLCKECHL